MRKLFFTIDVGHLRRIKPEIVPALFTKHQFRLLEKKFLQKRMTFSEKNEFSRAISRKMKAIHTLLGKETQGTFAYGKKEIEPGRLKTASLSKSPLPASDELAKQVEVILNGKNPKKIVQKIFVHAVVMGVPPKRALREMQEIISSYKETIKEYHQHKAYYLKRRYLGL